MDRVHEKASVGQVCRTSESLTSGAYQKSEYYNDHMRYDEDTWHATGLVFARAHNRFASLGIQLPKRFAEAHAPDVERTLSSLSRHLVQAFELSRLNNSTSDWQSLEEAPLPAIALSHKGRFLRANKACEALLEPRESALRIGMSGELMGTTQSQSEMLRAAIASVLTNRQASPVVALRSEGAEPLFVSVVPFARTLQVDPLVAQFVEVDHIGAIAYLMSADLRNGQISKSPFRGFGLTTAEAAVAEAYGVAGWSTQQIATARGVSIHTVRNQLAMAMEKLSATSSSDLSAKLSPLAGLRVASSRRDTEMRKY